MHISKETKFRLAAEKRLLEKYLTEDGVALAGDPPERRAACFNVRAHESRGGANAKSPTDLHVNTVKQRYNCKACGINGDAAAYLMQARGMTQRAALAKRDADIGLTIAERGRPRNPAPMRGDAPPPTPPTAEWGLPTAAELNAMGADAMAQAKRWGLLPPDFLPGAALAVTVNEYRHALTGEVEHVVWRLDYRAGDGRNKHVRQAHWDGAGVKWKLPPHLTGDDQKARPLFFIDGGAGAESAIVFEGEKCALFAAAALRGTPRHFISWSGGTGAVRKADWRALAEKEGLRRVLICADVGAADAGNAAAAAIARAADESNSALAVHVFAPDKEAGDIDDCWADNILTADAAAADGAGCAAARKWFTAAARAGKLWEPDETETSAARADDAGAVDDPMLLDVRDPYSVEHAIAAAGFEVRKNPRYTNAEFEMRRGGGAWQVVDDDALWAISFAIDEAGFKVLKRRDGTATRRAGLHKNAVDDVAQRMAAMNKHDPIKKWVAECGDKETPGLMKGLLRAMGADADNALNEEMMAAFWGGLAARIMKPGGMLRCFLVLRGEQGAGKSSFLSNVFPRDLRAGAVSTLRRAATDPKRFRESVGPAAIVEFAEARGQRLAEADEMKELLTKRADTFRPAYLRRESTFPRGFTFALTTNAARPLVNDPTGNTRYMVLDVKCGANGAHALAAEKFLDENRDALMACGVARMKDGAGGNLRAQFWKENAERNEGARAQDDRFADAISACEEKGFLIDGCPLRAVELEAEIRVRENNGAGGDCTAGEAEAIGAGFMSPKARGGNVRADLYFLLRELESRGWVSRRSAKGVGGKRMARLFMSGGLSAEAARAASKRSARGNAAPTKTNGAAPVKTNGAARAQAGGAPTLPPPPPPQTNGAAWDPDESRGERVPSWSEARRDYEDGKARMAAWNEKQRAGEGRL